MSSMTKTADLTTLTPVPIEQLQPGARYRVVIADCCVEAEFEARFEQWESRADRASGALDPYGVAVFEGGARVRDLVWFAYPA